MDLAQLSEWEVEVDWRENIGEGVWCKVWDCDLSKLHPELIKKYKGQRHGCPYIDSYGTGWRHAEPMTSEEVEKYIWEG